MNRFYEKEITNYQTQCNTCKNYENDFKCAAFPEGIPDKILFGEIKHNKPLPEQKNKI
jgi:hypothetical protein